MPQAQVVRDGEEDERWPKQRIQTIFGAHRLWGFSRLLRTFELFDDRVRTRSVRREFEIG
jgi:hypothetical protein